MRSAIRIFDIILTVILVPVFTLIVIGNYYLPSNATNYSESDFSYSSIFNVAKFGKTVNVDYQSANSVSENEKEIKLFNIFPVKNISVTNSNRQTVYVSGQCFGIKLYTNGVIVVGTQSVKVDKQTLNPAEDCGIKVGDVIVSINDEKVFSATRVQEILNENNGKTYKIRYKRNNKIRTANLTPVYSKSQGSYKAGMWVRDSTAGIGTISFFNSTNKSFAALGHPVNDVDTNEIMPLLSGEAVCANVTKIYKGVSGETGSLCCDFTNNVIGTLNSNTESGIYGTYENYTLNEKYIYEVASAQEVQRGKARILTTVDDEPKFYDIEIVKINYNNSGTQKNLVIKVTDDELLKITGGIVQGMSGSPIIQNNKLVAAVTHVIINNPTKGYAIFAENMLTQSNNIENIIK